MKVTVRAKARGYKSTSKNIREGKIGLNYQFYGPLFYARFLEFGTSHQPAYPFLRPAFEENKSALPSLIRDELAAAIDRTVRRLGK
jgi:HK97 gp10 family phage protein